MYLKRSLAFVFCLASVVGGCSNQPTCISTAEEPCLFARGVASATACGSMMDWDACTWAGGDGSVVFLGRVVNATPSDYVVAGSAMDGSQYLAPSSSCPVSMAGVGLQIDVIHQLYGTAPDPMTVEIGALGLAMDFEAPAEVAGGNVVWLRDAWGVVPGQLVGFKAAFYPDEGVWAARSAFLFTGDVFDLAAVEAGGFVRVPPSNCEWHDQPLHGLSLAEVRTALAACAPPAAAGTRQLSLGWDIGSFCADGTAPTPPPGGCLTNSDCAAGFTCQVQSCVAL